MKKIFRLVPIILLISCASVQSQPIESNGNQAFKLTCSEFNSSLEECKAKASELCANNYKILDHYKEVYPDAGDGFYMHPRHHVSVQCNS